MMVQRVGLGFGYILGSGWVRAGVGGVYFTHGLGPRWVLQLSRSWFRRMLPHNHFIRQRDFKQLPPLWQVLCVR